MKKYKNYIIYAVLIVAGVILANINYRALGAKLWNLVPSYKATQAELTEQEIFISTLMTFSDYLDKDYFEFIKTSDDLFMTMNSMMKISVFKESLSDNIKQDFKQLAKDIELAIMGTSDVAIPLTTEHIKTIKTLIDRFVKEHYKT